MADKDDEIVQKIKITVDDSELNKISADSKRLVDRMQKNLDANTPSVRVDFSKINSEASKAAKSLDAVTAAIGAVNAASTISVAKSLSKASTEAKNLATQTKAAAVEQQALNKSVKAFVPLGRDKATGRFLPRPKSAQPPVEPPPEIEIPQPIKPRRLIGRDPVTKKFIRIPIPDDADFVGPRQFVGPRAPPRPVVQQQPPKPPTPPLPKPKPPVQPPPLPLEKLTQEEINRRSQERAFKARERETLGRISAEEMKKRAEAFKQGKTFDGLFGREITKPPAGDSTGQLSEQAFSRLGLATLGVAGGVAALTAAFVGLQTALEGSRDAANKAGQRLGSFTGGNEAGREAFKGLQNLSKELGTSAFELAKPFEQLARIGGQSNKEMQTVLRNLTKSTQAEGVSEKQSTAALTKFLSETREKGFASDTDLKALQEVLPDTGKALQAAIEKIAPGAVGAGVIPARAVTQAAASAGFGDGAAKRLANAGDVATSVEKSITGLNSAAESLASAVGGGRIISTTIDAAAGFLNLVANSINGLKGPANTLLGAIGAAGKFVGSTVLSAGASTAQGLVRAGTDALGVTTSDKDQAAAAEQKKKADEAAAEASKKATEQAGIQAKQLAAHSARLGKAQAELDRRFLPQEQENDRERGAINVQRAEIAVQQAQLGAQEAQKQVALAGLAPGEAATRTDTARSSLEQIQLQQEANRLRKQGIDPDQDGDFQRKKQLADETALDNQERAAKQALVRAEIEERFAHLEAPKAELAARQAQIAIRSARLEQEDTSLKLAKDSEGQPIARDLAALKYAQAQLDVQTRLTAIGEEQLSTLNQILSALNRTGVGGEKSQRELSAERAAIDERLLPGQTPHGMEIGKPFERIDTVPRNLQDEGFKQVFPDSKGNFPPPPGLRSDALDQLNSSATQLAGTFDSINSAAAQQGAKPPQDAETAPATDDTASSLASLAEPVDAAATAATNLAAALERAANAANQGNVEVEAATGGLLHGPGTGTSDSMVVRASTGEYIVKAAATKFWGKDFMHSINNLRMPRFAAGGLIGALSPRMPRFAAGGVVDASNGGGSMQHLGTVDLSTNHGPVRVAVDGIGLKQLKKAAVMKNMGSDKKPSWVR